MFNKTLYNNIPTSLLAYWLSKRVIDDFKIGTPIEHYYDGRNGLTIGNNDLFLKQWFEINYLKIGFDCTDSINAFYTGKKWFPYNKGGEFRKWYGNQTFLINWESGGRDIKEYGHLVPRSLKYMFFECVSWSKICSSTSSFRFYPNGFMFDVAGLSFFKKDNCISDNYYYLLGFLNSNTAQYFLNAMSPTLNYEVGQVSNLPLIIQKLDKSFIENFVNHNICLVENDWNSFETSWNFKKHPLI